MRDSAASQGGSRHAINKRQRTCSITARPQASWLLLLLLPGPHLHGGVALLAVLAIQVPAAGGVLQVLQRQQAAAAAAAAPDDQRPAVQAAPGPGMCTPARVARAGADPRDVSAAVPPAPCRRNSRLTVRSKYRLFSPYLAQTLTDLQQQQRQQRDAARRSMCWWLDMSCCRAARRSRLERVRLLWLALLLCSLAGPQIAAATTPLLLRRRCHSTRCAFAAAAGYCMRATSSCCRADRLPIGCCGLLVPMRRMGAPQRCCRALRAAASLDHAAHLVLRATAGRAALRCCTRWEKLVEDLASCIVAGWGRSGRGCDACAAGACWALREAPGRPALGRSRVK